MNKKGQEYIQLQYTRLKKYNESVDNKNKIVFDPTSSLITERVMRLGVEARIYELETPGFGNYYITEDLETMARATLLESLLNSIIK